MSKQNRHIAKLSDRALEMIMRDVLDGLEEWLLESAYQGSGCEFEVIDLQPARAKRGANKNRRSTSRDKRSPGERQGEIIHFRPKRRAWG